MTFLFIMVLMLMIGFETFAPGSTTLYGFIAVNAFGDFIVTALQSIMTRAVPPSRLFSHFIADCGQF